MSMDDEARARIDVLKYTNGFVEMRVVRCMIELGLPEIFRNHGGPMTLSELSSAAGCPETVIYRIMRFLTHKGIFKKRFFPITGSDGPSLIYYTETPVSRLLARDNMGASVLIQAGSKETLLTPENLKAGKGSCLRSYSTEDELWNMGEVDEARLGLFRAYLASHAKGVTMMLINDFSKAFQGIESLVDVGGNEGMAVGMLVKAFPWIHGTNFDLPTVVSKAPVLEGVQHVGGDMFANIPKANAAMLMWILHDWGDEACIQILKKCRESLPKNGGKVMIVEAVLEDEEEEERDEFSGARLCIDMGMIIATANGKERTAKEWAQLVHAAGFASFTIDHMKATESLIQAYP